MANQVDMGVVGEGSEKDCTLCSRAPHGWSVHELVGPLRQEGLPRSP